MTIYIDENMPKHLAEGFHILQKPEGIKTGVDIEVKYIPTVFGKGVADEEWIPQVGKEKGFVITQDINIGRRKHQIELYQKHGLGMFFLRGTSKKQGLSVWQMVETLTKSWQEITNIINTQKTPFAYQIAPKGKLKKLT
jgi:hypothetical protein